MLNRVIVILLSTLCLLLHQSIFGQTAPANDDASNAIMIALGAGCGTTYTNIYATQAANEPLATCSDDPTDPAYSGKKIVWFKFIAPTSGAVRVSDNNPTLTFDSQIALFSVTDSDDYSTFQILACDDDCNCGEHALGSVLYIAGLTCGQTYYVSVSGWLPYQAGSFCLTIDEIDNTMLSTSNNCSSDYPGAWGGTGGWPINPHYKGWMSLMDAQCGVVVNVRDTAGVYANSFTCSQNVNQGAIRQLPSGNYYLDRNYLVHSTASDTAHIQLQFFFLNNEFNTLNTASGNNLTLYNLHVLEQNGMCENDFVSGVPDMELQQVGCINQYLGTTGTIDWVTTTTQFPSTGYANFFLMPGANVEPPQQTRDSICFGDAITIHGDQVCGLAWQTLPGGSPVSSLSCTDCANPVATPAQTTTYVETSSSISYCNDTTTVVIYHLQNGTRIDTNICFNSSIQLNTSANNNSSYSYVWQPSLYLNNSTISNPVCTPSADTNITYTVMITDSAHCSIEDTFNITHLNKISLPGPDTTVCKGTPFSIPLSGSASFNYIWSPNINLNNNVIEDPIITADSAIVYKVIASYLGCQDSAFYGVAVNMPPVVDSISTINCTACGACDGSLTFHGLAFNQTYNVSYLHNDILQTATITSDSLGNATIGNACQGAYDSIVVHSSSCPSATLGPITIAAPPIVPTFTYIVHYGCRFDTVEFTNTSQYSGTVRFRWDFGDNTFDTITTNPIHVYNNNSTFYATLFISNTFCIDSVTDTLGFSHLLKAGFTDNGTLFCQGQQVAFTNSSIGATVTYLWSFGDGTTDTAVNPVHTYTNAGTYIIQLIETDLVPCQDTITATVQVDSISSILLALSDSAVCEGKAMVFTGTYLDSGIVAITWNFGDGAIIKDVNPVQHAYDTIGTFMITLSANYRVCPDTSISKEVHVYPYPTVDIGPDTSICPGQSFALQLTNMASGQIAGYTNDWSTGDTAASITADAVGPYWLTVTTDEGCKASDTMEVKPNCYLAIPNVFTPNGDGINDYFFPRQLLSDGLVSFKMEIYNRWGELIFSTTNTDGRGWDGRFNNVPQPEGVYVYIIDAIFKNSNNRHWQGNVTLLR